MHKIQSYNSGLGGLEHRIRVGNCLCCHSPIFNKIDPVTKIQENPDPRWPYGPKRACVNLVAREYDMEGEDVLICFDCHQTSEKHKAAIQHAKSVWKNKE